jgi:hypothetical protein
VDISPNIRQPYKPAGFASDLEYIERVLLPEWFDEFRIKNADYGDDSGKLGVMGGFTDLWRKIHKLKRSVWDGQELHGEQTREIVMDMIGHAFLLVVDLDGFDQALTYQNTSIDEVKQQPTPTDDVRCERMAFGTRCNLDVGHDGFHVYKNAKQTDGPIQMDLVEDYDHS